MAAPLPWYARGVVLLGIGATALAGSIVFAVAAGDASTADPEPEAPAVEEPAFDASRYEPTWVFNDPNRALGDGLDTLDARTAVWLLDDAVVVASVDTVRAHSLEDGSALWDAPVDGQVCAAATDVPAEAAVVVVGHGEDCSTLTAIDVADGQVRWEETPDEDDFFLSYEKIVMTPAGVFTYDGDGVTLRDADTGRVLGSVTDDDVFAASAVPGMERAYLGPEAALTADGSVLVVQAYTRAVVDGDPEPTLAVGIDPETAEILWTAQVKPTHVDLIPHAQDGAVLIVGELPGEIVRLDPATGQTLSTYAVPADSEEGGRAEYERYPFDGPDWYRSGVAFVDGDPVLSYSNVTHVYGDGNRQTVQNLVRVDIETGQEVWRLRPSDISVATDGAPVAPDFAAGPMLDENRMLVIYSGIGQAYVLVIDVRTGEELAVAPQSQELADSSIQQEPAVFMVDDQVLLAFNPQGGTNKIDEDAENGTDPLSLALLHPVG